MDEFCRKLPKVELHAHLNGSLSHATMHQLKRYHADIGLEDGTDAFTDEFQVGAGDNINLTDVFQVFSIAHALTTTPKAVGLATALTLQEYQADGCCYIELRSTPRETPQMTRMQYIDAIVDAIWQGRPHLSLIAKYIVSIDRKLNISQIKELTDLAIESKNKYPDVVCGVELSGNPTLGNFEDFIPYFTKARNEGLKVTLHCGEVINPKEIASMLAFKPDRIGHAVCVHPRFGGTEDIWNALRESKIPVEVCLTSNVNTKSVPSYEEHHFKDLYENGIPVNLGTDDKGVFSTSLTQEYMICAETFGLNHQQLAQLSLDSCQHIFDDTAKGTLTFLIDNFMKKFSSI